MAAIGKPTKPNVQKLVSKQVLLISLGAISLKNPNLSPIALQIAETQPFKKLPDGRHFSKMSHSNGFGGFKPKFQISAFQLIKQLRYEHLKSEIAAMGKPAKPNLLRLVSKKDLVIDLWVISLNSKFEFCMSSNS